MATWLFAALQARPYEAFLDHEDFCDSLISDNISL